MGESGITVVGIEVDKERRASKQHPQDPHAEKTVRREKIHLKSEIRVDESTNLAYPPALPSRQSVAACRD